MANYIASVNQLIMSKCSKIPGAVLYGQNLNNGTFISGLTKNIAVHETGRIINTPNVENTLCGMGFGMMLAGVKCVYFVKQLDFMLLGLDHFVNTYNFIRCSRNINELGSFSIIMLVCDQGMQGPQSSFSGYADFSSMARIACYSITNNQDTPRILETVTQPGFRMIGLSSRLCRSEFIQTNLVYSADDNSVFQYTEGADATIVCFNFSLAEGQALHKKLLEKGMASSLFSVNYVPYPDWTRIRQSVAITGRLVVMDDSKSVHLPAYSMLDAIAGDNLQFKRVVVVRGPNVDFGIDPDLFPVNYNDIMLRLGV